MSSTPRLASLDQFRGYTVAGMFFVNFIGGYWASLPNWQHHNTFCSYADTIMPQFFFAVGFAFRLSFGRRLREGNRATPYFRFAKRFFGLLLVSLVVYGLGSVPQAWQELVDQGFWSALNKPLKVDYFQTLTHIAVTSLWILPVIHLGIAARTLWMLLGGLLHAGLSGWFYFDWVYEPPSAIDGGPLGFLTWSIPTLWGSILCDWMAREEGVPANWIRALGLSLLLMGIGWGLSCFSRLYDVSSTIATEAAAAASAQAASESSAEPSNPVFFSPGALTSRSWQELIAEPPFVPPPGSRAAEKSRLFAQHDAPWYHWLVTPAESPPPDESDRFRQRNYWMMSQKGGTLSYHLFAAGLAGFLFVLFFGICDRAQWNLGIFRTLGSNALAGYLIHMWVDDAIGPLVPKDAPPWYLLGAFGIYFLITYLLLRGMEKQGIFLKV